MPKKVAFLSTDNLEKFFTYDKLLIDPMKKIGWDAEEISWRKENVNWFDYDAVIVRSTWDYQNDPEKFLKVLDDINRTTHLENDLDLMRWNMNKKYLFDLEKKGIRIVDTIWENTFYKETVHNYFDELKSREIIIKPNISANADNTFRLNKENIENNLATLENIFCNREFMVQPFMHSIIEEGEFSLFFFYGEFSHAVLKRPKSNDFRVQEEHGGKFKSITPTDQQIAIAKKIVDKLIPLPLYARTDLVRTLDNDFALMELEIIEPSLYLNTDPKSPERFVARFAEKMKSALV